MDNWNFGPVSNEVGLRFTVPVRELGESQSVDLTRPDLRGFVEIAKEDRPGFGVAKFFVAALGCNVRLGSIERNGSCWG